MPSISDLFRKEIVEWEGRKLVITHASFKVEGAYRTYLESEARAAISRNRADMDLWEWKTQMSAWQEACAAHAYEVGGEAWNRSLASKENSIRWFWLLVTQDDENGKQSPNIDMTLTDMKRCWKDASEAISEAWGKIQADEKEAEDDPSPAPPV